MPKAVPEAMSESGLAVNVRDWLEGRLVKSHRVLSSV